MKGLTSNKMKIIAIILMVLDHIGYYFVSYISDEMFNSLRFVGRIAMPIFAFLLVQGFFNTKSRVKYIFRVFIVATICQTLIFTLGIVNNVFVKNYYIVINTYLNILYSFAICLAILTILEKTIIKKQVVIDRIIKIAIVIAFISIYFLIDLELGLRVPITIIGIYLAEKLYKLGNIKSEGYIIIIFTTLLIGVFTDYKYILFNLPSILAIVPISLYNGKRGKSNKFIQWSFYLFYPIHHVILYITALLITHKVR